MSLLQKIKNKAKLFKKYYPEIANEIASLSKDNALIKKISSLIHLGSQDNLIKFIIENYNVPKGENNIPDFFKADWRNFDIILKKIYELRSGALHSGQSFPEEMCKPPMVHWDDKIILAERPLKTTSFKRKSTIHAEDKPLLLWKFEEIVRVSLRNWLLTLK